MEISKQAEKMKLKSPVMANQPVENRNRALLNIAENLWENRQNIYAANLRDMKEAEELKIASPLIKRLKFDETKLLGSIQGLKDLAGLKDPLFQVQLERELDQDLLLIRETCPIGVIGVIFESRPDALIQISSLCIKSGNCSILKGGREALHTNEVLFQIIYASMAEAGLPEDCLFLAKDREEINELLKCDGSVDLIIPRGSNQFVKYIMDNTRIPVMGHDEGICHIYVDEKVDFEMAVRVILDAKTQYVAACNTVETVLIHENIVNDFLPVLAEGLSKAGVRMKGTEEIKRIIDCEPAEETDFKTEYSDYIINLKTVASMKEAVDHINRFGSHHTDSILTDKDENADYFMKYVDSAGVYQNCSTRFADGFRYGFGAEVGISTAKLHARGPVGLEGLVTYKYKLKGKGNIAGDYVSGERSFHFKDHTR